MNKLGINTFQSTAIIIVVVAALNSIVKNAQLHIKANIATAGRRNDMSRPKLNKGYGFLRRKKCFGQMDLPIYLPCSECSDEEQDKCFIKTFGEFLHDEPKW